VLRRISISASRRAPPLRAAPAPRIRYPPLGQYRAPLMIFVVARRGGITATQRAKGA